MTSRPPGGALSTELRELMESKVDDSRCPVDDVDFSLSRAHALLISSLFTWLYVLSLSLSFNSVFSNKYFMF